MFVEIVDAKNVHFDAIPKEEHIGLKDWDSVRQCYILSEERWIGKADGEFACVWGLIPPTLLSNSAYLWLHCNALVERHKFLFIRHSQRQLEIMLQYYPMITGNCLTNNLTAKRWLQWLGAKFDSPKNGTVGKLLTFEIRNQNG